MITLANDVVSHYREFVRALPQTGRIALMVCIICLVLFLILYIIDDSRR
jgi:hypothetical protein